MESAGLWVGFCRVTGAVELEGRPYEHDSTLFPVDGLPPGTTIPNGYIAIWFCAMSVDPLSTTLGALSDPTRRAILSRLAMGAATVTELAEPFDMTMPAVSKHLKVLERAGLITRGRDAQRRPCHLRAEPLKEAADWIEHYRSFWEARFDRMARYLDELQRKDDHHDRTKE